MKYKFFAKDEIIYEAEMNLSFFPKPPMNIVIKGEDYEIKYTEWHPEKNEIHVYMF